jgi:alanyl-tRNA synthetase
VFAGNDEVPRDNESIAIWKQVFAKYGIEALVSDNPQDIQKNFDGQGRLLNNPSSYRIFTYSGKKNWWERGYAAGELGGPDSEVFYDLGPEAEAYSDPELHVNSDNGRFLEIGNNVFMQYQLDKDLRWQPLAQKNVDFGGGFERTVMCVQGKTDIFETDLFEPILKVIENLSGYPYKTNGKENEWTKAFRVIADHGRVSTFLLADGVLPSNKDQGYILRRFIRRMVRFGLRLGLDVNFTGEIAMAVISRMGDVYPHLHERKEEIIVAINKEETAFRQTLMKGLKEFRENFDNYLPKREVNDIEVSLLGLKVEILGKDLFRFYETYGFPLELAIEEFEQLTQYFLNPGERSILEQAFNEAKESHRLQSQKGAEQKFKGGLADQSVETTKLHTAHHLLLAALQKVVDSNIRQRGSNITAERLRIDFNLDRKLTAEEITAVEELVNQQIKKHLPVERREMSKTEAEKLGAQMEFGQKYGDTVSVYFIGNAPEYFSVEFCGGPHVKNTFELSDNGTKRFKILKEEASGAGIRRIKAALIPVS